MMNNKDLVHDPGASQLLTVIEAMDLFIAILWVEGPKSVIEEAEDIRSDLYYLYAELVKNE